MESVGIPKIIFEDPNILIISKPCGLLSQPDISQEPSLIEWAQGYLGRHYVGLVHRLDRNVSGLMIIAKRTKAAARLTEDLQKNQLRRFYQAWIEGDWTQELEIQGWLVHSEVNNQSKFVQTDVPPKGGKFASTRLIPLEKLRVQGKIFSRVECQLDTGRQHQIRATLSEMGHPIVGDQKYGSKFGSTRRLALHSTHISFRHPVGDRSCLRFHESINDLHFYL